jgi:hypothetical protein
LTQNERPILDGMPLVSPIKIRYKGYNEGDKMNKKEQRMLDNIFNLDCYDQELWVIDNEDFIKNASDEFKSHIKDLNFKTGQSALENFNADFYNQIMRGE